MLPGGVGVATVSLVAHHHLEQFFGLAHRQRFQDYCVDQAENRSVGSDSEGERKNRNGSEAGTSTQGAEGVAKILIKCIEHNKNSMHVDSPPRAPGNHCGLGIAVWRGPPAVKSRRHSVRSNNEVVKWRTTGGSRTDRGAVRVAGRNWFCPCGLRNPTSFCCPAPRRA